MTHPLSGEFRMLPSRTTTIANPSPDHHAHTNSIQSAMPMLSKPTASTRRVGRSFPGAEEIPLCTPAYAAPSPAMENAAASTRVSTLNRGLMTGSSAAVSEGRRRHAQQVAPIL